MLNLISTPATLPRISRPVKPARVMKAATPAELIWNLHSVVAHPASEPSEVKRAKRRLLEVLGEKKNSPRPEMIVAAMNSSPDFENEERGWEEAPEETLVCATCKRPVEPAFNENRTVRAKGARESRPRNFRASRSKSRSEATSSPAVEPLALNSSMNRTQLLEPPRKTTSHRIFTLPDAFRAAVKKTVGRPAPSVRVPLDVCRWENEGGRWLEPEATPARSR